MAEKAQKLEAFVWEGKDRKGNKAKGELAGSNIALVKAQLRKQFEMVVGCLSSRRRPSSA